MGRIFSLRLALLTALAASGVLVSETAHAGKPAQEKPAPQAVDVSAGILAGETAADARIEKALDEPTELEFSELPLSDVIDNLMKKHKIEIQLDNKALEEAGVATDTPVSRHLKNVSLRSALKQLLRELDLTYIVRDELLLVTTTAQAEVILLVRVYPVGDLLEFGNLEVIDLHPVPGLIETITGTVAMTAWNEVGGSGSIKYSSHANSLVVAQSYAVHEEVRDLLIALRKAQGLERVQSKQQAADGGQGNLFVAVYPLSSMAIVHHMSAAPPSSGDTTSGSAGTGKPASASQGSMAVSNRGLAEELTRVIPKLIEPASWQTQGGQGSIESVGIGVAVRQTRQVHREVARFLRSFDTRIPGGLHVMSGAGMFRLGMN